LDTHFCSFLNRQSLQLSDTSTFGVHGGLFVELKKHTLRLGTRSIMKLLASSLLAGLFADSIESFQITVVLRRMSAVISQGQSLRLRKHESNDDEEAEVECLPGIPQLPAFGSSSFSNPTGMEGDLATSSLRHADGDIGGAAFASPKFKLQYTCNVCDARNSHMVSRLGKIAICGQIGLLVHHAI
jgi:hypothetical protein